jgi:hypothetical protein
MLLAWAFLRSRMLLRTIGCHVESSGKDGRVPGPAVRISAPPLQAAPSLSNQSAPQREAERSERQRLPFVQPLPHTMSAVWPPPVEALS